MNTFPTARKGRGRTLSDPASSAVMQKIGADVDGAIRQGLFFLRSRQRRSGGFNVYRAASLGFENWELRHTSLKGFPVAFSNEGDQMLPALSIGHSLLHLRGCEEADRMLRKITRYIVENRLPGRLWKNNRSKDGSIRATPVDLQTTAKALTFLRQVGEPVKVPGATLLSNRDARGLFHTFVAPRLRRGGSPGYWKAALGLMGNRAVMSLFGKAPAFDRDDISVPLNTYLLPVLGPCPASGPVLCAIRDLLVQREEGDRYGWFRDPFTVYRILSGAFRLGVSDIGEHRETIRERVVACLRPDGSFNGEVTDTARAVCILLDFGFADAGLLRSVLWLVSRQNADGSWDKRACYFDAGKADTVVAYGSEDIVTALCLEAISRCKGSFLPGDGV